METMTTSVGTSKHIARICLVTPSGDRLLDTLVGQQDLPEGAVVAAPKEGLRKQLNSLAADIGPSIHDIRAVITYFSKGKALVGYHMPLKL